MDLKNYLKSSGTRQQDFALLVGETQGYVSRIVSKKCLVGATTALKWSAATGFQVTPHDLRPDIYPNPTDGIPDRDAA
jgi:Uncharacterized protein conserved in bacteria, prophage-related